MRELRDIRESCWQDEDPKRRAEADLLLHLEIVAATHNPLFTKLYASMLDVFAEHMREETGTAENAAHGHHHDLVEAIAEGDADRATASVAAIFSPFMSS